MTRSSIVNKYTTQLMRGARCFHPTVKHRALLVVKVGAGSGWQAYPLRSAHVVCGERMQVSSKVFIASLAFASYGLAAGRVYITDLLADDPDESGHSFGELDTLSVLFSEPTSEPLASSGLGKSDVDALLAFSSEVRGDYWAFWNTSRLLIVHFGVVEADSAPVPGVFRVSCRAAATEAILPQGTSNGRCEGSSPPLRGAWGYARPSLVEISSIVAHDPDDGDEVCTHMVFSTGDLILTPSLAPWPEPVPVHSPWLLTLAPHPGSSSWPLTLARTLTRTRSSAWMTCSRCASPRPPTARGEPPTRGSSIRRKSRRC